MFSKCLVLTEGKYNLFVLCTIFYSDSFLSYQMLLQKIPFVVVDPLGEDLNPFPPAVIQLKMLL